MVVTAISTPDNKTGSQSAGLGDRPARARTACKKKTRKTVARTSRVGGSVTLCFGKLHF